MGRRGVHSDVLGVSAVAVWSAMVVGAVFATLWAGAVPGPLYSVLMFVWCVGMHMLALWLYRRDLRRWRQQGRGTAPPPR